ADWCARWCAGGEDRVAKPKAVFLQNRRSGVRVPPPLLARLPDDARCEHLDGGCAPGVRRADERDEIDHQAKRCASHRKDATACRSASPDSESTRPPPALLSSIARCARSRCGEEVN